MAKTKNITRKQFEEIVFSVFDKEIFGYGGLINMLSIHERESAKEAREYGCEAAAAGCEKRADLLFHRLYELGYYND